MSIDPQAQALRGSRVRSGAGADRLRGYTLSELIVTIVIIGILALIALLAYRAIVDQSTDAAARATATQVEKLYLADSAIHHVPISPQTVNDVSTLSFGADMPEGVSAVLVDSGGVMTVTTAQRTCTGRVFSLTVPGQPAQGEWDCSGSGAGGSGGSSPTGLPGQPRALAATTGTSQVTLTWLAPLVANPAVVDYRVEYSSGSGWTTFPDAVSATTGATVTGLADGTLYSFRVAAVNAVGTGPYSVATTATVGVHTYVVGFDGTSNAQSGPFITATSDGGFVVTGSSGGGILAGDGVTLLSVPYGAQDAFVAKMSATGVWQWATPMHESTNDGRLVRPTSILQSADSSILIAGDLAVGAQFGSMPVSVPGGGTGAFVASVDVNTGTFTWVTPLGPTCSNCTGYGIAGMAAAPSNGAYVAVALAQGVGLTLDSCVVPASGIGGQTTAAVLRLSSAGQCSWAAPVDAGSTTAPDGVLAAGIAATSDGGAALVGLGSGVSFGSHALGILHNTSTSLPGHAFVAKVSAAGAWQWVADMANTSQSGSRFVRFTTATSTADGGVAVVGSYRGVVDASGSSLSLPNLNTNSDMLVGKVSSAGAWQWVEHSTGAANEEATGVALLADGSLVVAGTYTSGGAQFGLTDLLAPVSGAGYVASISGGGAWRWANALESTGQSAMSNVSATAGGVLAVGTQGYGVSPVTLTVATTTLASSPYGSLFAVKLNSAGQYLPFD